MPEEQNVDTSQEAVEVQDVELPDDPDLLLMALPDQTQRVRLLATGAPEAPRPHPSRTTQLREMPLKPHPFFSVTEEAADRDGEDLVQASRFGFLGP